MHQLTHLFPALVLTLLTVGCQPGGNDSDQPAPQPHDLKSCLTLCVESEGDFFHEGCVDECNLAVDKFGEGPEPCPERCGRLGQARDNRVRARCHIRCASDNDLDGVPNNADRCPENSAADVAGPAPPGPLQVNRRGCPDNDGDGVANEYDRCPGSEGPVDSVGCPERPRQDAGVPAGPGWVCEGEECDRLKEAPIILEIPLETRQAFVKQVFSTAFQPSTCADLTDRDPPSKPQIIEPRSMRSIREQVGELASDPTNFEACGKTAVLQVKNPGGEQGTDDWIVEEGALEAIANAACDSKPPYESKHVFAVGGVCGTHSEYGVARQRIDLTNLSDQLTENITSNQLQLNFSGQLRNHKGKDEPGLQTRFWAEEPPTCGQCGVGSTCECWNGSKVGGEQCEMRCTMLTSPLVTTKSAAYTKVDVTTDIPNEAVAVDVVLIGRRHSGDDNDSYFDDLELTLVEEQNAGVLIGDQNFCMATDSETLEIPMKWSRSEDPCPPVTYSVSVEYFYCDEYAFTADEISGSLKPLIKTDRGRFINAGWCQWQPFLYETLSETEKTIEFPLARVIHNMKIAALGMSTHSQLFQPMWLKLRVMAHDGGGNTTSTGLHERTNHVMIYRPGTQSFWGPDNTAPP